MWFKNITAFRLLEDFPLSAEQLEEKLFAERLRPCGATQLSSFGWTSPFGRNSDVLVHSANGYYLLAAAREEKLLPSTVVNQHLTERLIEVEQQEARKIYQKEKKNLRDDIIFELLPQAFVKRSTLFAFLDPKHKLLVIDSSSLNKAEEFTVLLGRSLGRLQLAPIETKSNPNALMTSWLQGKNIPGDFTIEDYCELLDPKTGMGLIKCQKQDLLANEVLGHIQSGKQVTRIALSWADKMTFVLNEDLSLSRIKCLDVLNERIDELEAETTAEKIDIDFVLMSLEFSTLLKDVFTLFDGVITHTTAEAKSEEQVESA